MERKRTMDGRRGTPLLYFWPLPYVPLLPKINMLRSFDEAMRNHMINEGMEPHNILRYDYDVLTVRWIAMRAGVA